MTRYVIVHELDDFKKGDRVESHPATDLWMRGLRYGDVVKVGRSKVYVRFDRRKTPVAMLPLNLLKLDA